MNRFNITDMIGNTPIMNIEGTAVLDRFLSPITRLLPAVKEDLADGDVSGVALGDALATDYCFKLFHISPLDNPNGKIELEFGTDRVEVVCPAGKDITPISSGLNVILLLDAAGQVTAGSMDGGAIYVDGYCTPIT